MNKADFITEIKERTGFKKKEIDVILDSMLDTIMETVKSGEKISFVGFGAFSANKREDRKGINPNTKEELIIPSRIQPKFTAGQVFKDIVNNREVSKKFSKNK